MYKNNIFRSLLLNLLTDFATFSESGFSLVLNPLDTLVLVFLQIPIFYTRQDSEVRNRWQNSLFAHKL